MGYFCKTPELIENYEKAVADKTQTWCCHHRLETHFSDGTPRPKNAFLSPKELIALGMYFDRPPEELIFLTKAEHASLHGKDQRRHKKQSEALKGRKRPRDVVKKISESHKGRRLPEEVKTKLSINHKGLLKDSQWFTNGIINKRGYECPEGFWVGRVWKNKKGER